MSMVAHTCPSDDQLLAFSEGLLGAAEREGVEEHLAGCADCSAVVGATCRASAQSEYTEVGRYEVGEELGRGGMGRVLRARDPSLDRDVAVKLILPAALSRAARERFAREAETLGKLRHPNVLEVFDVGEFDGTPYFVMEFVDGHNLDAWSRGRGLREILECLRHAGAGLAAAHAAGVLHRDFKPSNVIVGRDGRPRVGDFGLAGFDVPETIPNGGAPVDSLTKTGATLGTVAYMAPELLDGGKATAASDQFAFCVTMYEVLYGKRPFAGADVRGLAASIRCGEILLAPSGVSIPRRARRAVVRGLSAEPGERFPSLHALLRELRPARSPRRLGLGLAAGSGLVLAAFALAGPRTAACSSFAGELDGIYDPQVRDRIRTVFSGSDQPYARASSRSTLEGLDAYAEHWIDGATQACHASEQGELPGDALDLRMRCLRHAAQNLAAMVELLESPEEAPIERGGELVAALPNLELCSDPDVLERLVVLPADAAEAAQAETLGPILSRAHTRTLADDFDGAWALVERHAEALDAATYPPIKVRALRVRARVLLARKNLAEARAASLQAHRLAVEHRLDRDASRTATFLGRIASHSGDTQEAQRWFDLALALAQAGEFNQLQAFSLTSASRFYADRGELDRAAEAAGRAVELIEDDTTYPPTSRAEVLLAYADRLFVRGGGDDGRAQLQEAQRILLAVHGDLHPALGGVERALQVRASRRGDYQASFEHGREALRITLAVHGEGSLQEIPASVNLAIALKELGRHEDAALALERADALLDAWPAYIPAMRIQILTNLGSVMLKLRRNDAARDVLVRARSLLEARTDQRESSVLVDELLSLVELREGNLKAARRLATGALEVSVGVFGEEHFRTADVWIRLGHVELEARNFETARALLARAMSVEDSTEADRGEATFLLARSTLEDPIVTATGRARAIELAVEAKLALTSKPAYAQLRTEVEAWIELHSPPM
ncbi:MAG: protein kinase [Nannocystaceae bacterium]|nr:protein kinase [Nannocystaceae bacterium]